MSDQATGDATDSAEELRSEPCVPDAVQETETYRTDDGTVFYDAGNPLAWIQTDDTLALQDWH